MGTEAVGTRAAELRTRLGDLLDSANPLGHAAVLAADERAEMFAEGERVLDEFGFNSEFVPAELGGRLRRLDELIDVLRAVYRHDPCLGAGYGVSSFIAASTVWAVGSAEQRADVATLLVNNGKLAAAYNELAHGNDLPGCEVAVTPNGHGRVLNGRKEVITNAARADALVVFARTSPKPGSRSHTPVLVNPAAAPSPAVVALPRYRTDGLRGLPLAGVEFRDCPVADDQLIGEPGHGLETALRSFQVTRVVLSGMTTGLLDTALRVALRHVSSRSLYGGAAMDLPWVRAQLAAAYADLVVCETVVDVAARAVHLIPAEASLHAASAKYLVSGLVSRAVGGLAGVLGAHSYVRDGATGMFQKLVRDVKSAAIVHASRVACQQAILPQLALLARRSWHDTMPPAPELFRSGAELPHLRWDRLSVSAKGLDRLSPLVLREADRDQGDGRLGRVVADFADELRNLAEECVDLSVGQLQPSAGPRSYELVSRFVTVSAGAACLGRWRDQDPVAVAALLTRLPLNGKRRCATPAPEQTERLLAQLWQRYPSDLSH
uniref:Acyl-CoA dehydrogenase n=2 Tax=Saccharomonospora piscinae TaxID=687388 RepID=W5VFB8_SACPI|nr:acyl-CoA dehydrogenase [Saccharomonospora piscinae]